MKYLMSAILVTYFALASISSMADETRVTGAKVTVKDLSGIKVHAYVAPYEMFAVSTYIVESEHELVLFDAQMFTPLAMDFRAYADSLNKPINRLILTHGHPDHYLGLIAFEDVPIFTFEETITEISKTGESTRIARKQMMGKVIPDHVVVPTKVLSEGIIKIDNISYDISKVKGGEHSPMVVTKLPEYGVISIGDTAMNGVHLFLASDFEPWIKVLEDMNKQLNASLVLTGHGGIGDQSILTSNIKYLKKATELMKSETDPQIFRRKMIAAFPELNMTAAIDFFLPYLFPEKQ